MNKSIFVFLLTVFFVVGLGTKQNQVYGLPTHSTNQAKFGNSSIFFDGNPGHLEIQDSNDWHFNSDDFTIDFWINSSTFGGYNRGIFTQYESNTLRNRVEIDIGWLEWQIWDGDPPLINLQFPVNDWQINRWYHVALVRHKEQFIAFRDGTVIDSEIYSAPLPDIDSEVYIGKGYDRK